jgi:hypothetical protein
VQAKVVAHEATTKMTSEALAIAVGPTVFPGLPRSVYPVLLTLLLSEDVWAGREYM